MNKKRRIVITGGVLTPGLAVINELQKRGRWEIFWLGRKYSLEGEKIISVESKIIPQTGSRFIPIIAGRLQRRFTRYTIPSLLKIPLSLLQSLMLLAQIKPDVVCSFGGYVSVPVVITAWFLRIPVLTHEQTVISGLASKIDAFFASKVALSFSQSSGHFPKGKVIVTGNPLRSEFFQVKKPTWFRLEESASPIIYITGGNQGAQVINNAVKEALRSLLQKYILIHQTGDKDYEIFKEVQSRLGEREQRCYFVLPYIKASEVGWVFKKASLVVSRAGANTLSELAVLGKPALFIPIPWSYQDEQTKNAQLLLAAGTAEILAQKELSGESLLQKVDLMMSRLDDYQKGASKAKALVPLNGAENLVNEIERLLA